MRYLLDEDLPQSVAEVTRNLGLDVISVHEIARRGYSDDQQLAFAASEERVMVTRNRDDFIRLTVACYQAGTPHAGVLIVPVGLPNRRPEAIAYALRRWDESQRSHEPVFRYGLDFLKRRGNREGSTP